MMLISMREWAHEVDLEQELFYRPTAVKLYEKLFPAIQYLQGGTLLDLSLIHI